MSTHPQLEWSQGTVDQAELEKLRRENHDLKRQLKDEREQSQEAIRDARKQSLQAVRAQSKLKSVLSPIYQAFQMIFDELEGIDLGEGMQPNAYVDGPSREKWEIWKRKLPGKPAEFIQALLEHGELNSAQLKSLTHSGTSTVPQIIYKLNSLGLINKNGGRYSLKQI